MVVVAVVADVEEVADQPVLHYHDSLFAAVSQSEAAGFPAFAAFERPAIPESDYSVRQMLVSSDVAIEPVVPFVIVVVAAAVAAAVIGSIAVVVAAAAFAAVVVAWAETLQAVESD